jgi:small subunit ribosomal protein S20
VPITKSAKKALKQSLVKKARNTVWKKRYKLAIKKVSKAIETNSKNIDVLVSDAYSLIDKTAKQNIIHKNKAARLKSGIAKKIKEVKITLKKKSSSKPKEAKKNVKKAPAKKIIKKTKNTKKSLAKSSKAKSATTK